MDDLKLFNKVCQLDCSVGKVLEASFRVSAAVLRFFQHGCGLCLIRLQYISALICSSSAIAGVSRCGRPSVYVRAGLISRSFRRTPPPCLDEEHANFSETKWAALALAC
ncbi:hypothetical protein MHYP_G00350670 [Metynnis hypsauchen]